MTKQEAKSINKATLRLLEVLSAFVGAGRPLGASELCRALGMSRNMVHRALVTLSEEDFLHKDVATGRYVLSHKLARLQNTSAATPNLRRTVRPFLRELSERTGETVQLCVRSGDVQTVIDGIEGTGTTVLRVKLGRATPLHASVASRAILAAMKDAGIEGYLNRNMPLKKFTGTTLTKPAQIWAEVEAIRQRGHSLAFGDYNPSTAGFGFPIRDFEGRPFGAIAVGGPIERFRDENLAVQIETAREIIARLERITRLYEVT